MRNCGLNLMAGMVGLVVAMGVFCGLNDGGCLEKMFW